MRGVRWMLSLGAVLVLGVAGCKVDDGSTDSVNNSPDASSTSQTTSAAESSAAPSSSAATKAVLGQAITIEGNDDGARIKVTASKFKSKVKATDGFSTPDDGKRYVAVRFRIENTGTAAYDDSPTNGAKVADSEGQQFDADFATETSAGASLPSSVKLSAGGSALGYMIFQVPKDAKVTLVQFSTDSGFGETAEWVIR